MLFLKPIRKVVPKIYLYKKQDHFGNRNKMRRATEKPEALMLTTEDQVYRSQRRNCRMHGDKDNVTKLIEMFEKHQHKEQFLNDMSRKQEINRFSEESQKLLVDMNPQRSSNFARILKNFNVLIAIPLRKSGSLFVVAGEISSTKRSPITTQKANDDYTSMPGFLSLSRTSLENQSTANLNDKSCSSRRRRFLRKQDKKNMAAFRRFFQDGMHKKDTEGHWRSRILAKKKLCLTIASLHELNDYRTPNIGFFVRMLMGTRNLVDSDKIFPMH